MPRVHHVKNARKKNPVAEAGEPYYWWKPNWGAKRYSKTYPKPSQLTGSAFLSEYLSIGEDLNDAAQAATTGADLQAAVEEAVSRIEGLRDETQDSFDNMPEGFQQGDTGEMLQARVDGLEQWQEDLEGVDVDIPDADHIDAEDGDITDPAELVDNAREELLGFEPEIY
jgi:hypothetical protein